VSRKIKKFKRKECASERAAQGKSERDAEKRAGWIYLFMTK